MIMNRLKSPLSPSWYLIGASAAALARTIVPFISAPSLAGASAIAVAIGFVWLLLRGSRIAWVVVFVGAVGDIVSAEVVWVFGCGVVMAVGLLMPPSVRYVWNRKHYQQVTCSQLGIVWIRQKVQWIDQKARTGAFSGLSRFAGWKSVQLGEQVGRALNYSSLLWRLGIACVVLLLCAGFMDSWQHGAGRDSSLVAVLADLARFSSVLTQVAFIVTAVIALYHRKFSSTPKP
jgi:hypothetical protein